MPAKTVLITGNSTGLGRALTEVYLSMGAQVYGFSRSACDLAHTNLHDAKLDLANLEALSQALNALLKGANKFDLVLLNAGVLGEIKPIHQLDLNELGHVMDINVWSNKILLDYLYQSKVELNQVVAISSGAAVNGNKGWGAYSLSKASLNMLIKLYAAEYENTHFISLAPGLVDTRMQDLLCDQSIVDETVFPSVAKLRAARGTEAMPGPTQAAENITRVLAKLKQECASGEFVDMRNI